MALMETLGAGAGLLAVGLLSRQTGELFPVVPFVGAATLVSALLLLFLPEASRRELETICHVEPAAAERPTLDGAPAAAELRGP